MQTQSEGLKLYLINKTNLKVRTGEKKNAFSYVNNCLLEMKYRRQCNYGAYWKRRDEVR